MTEIITVHGGLTAAPEIHFSQNGLPIISGTIASTDRYKDRNGEWQDGKRLYLRYSGFREIAENIAASNLDKGAQVVVTGKLLTREFQDRDGNPRSSIELEIIDFAVSLRRATAQVTRSQRPQSGQERPEGSNTGSWPSATESGPQTGAQPFTGDGWEGAGNADVPF